jgi:GNAT superfamily N-acetyltransferase
MIELRPVTDRTGSELSLSLFNETVPERSASIEESLAYQAAAIDHLDCVAYLDGKPAGSAFVVIEPYQRETDVAHVMLTVPPPHRRRGIGSRLLERVSAWAAERGRGTLEGWTYEADPPGGEFARHRGFVEVVREARVALELRGRKRAPVDLPTGLEIVTWAERPELIDGIYEVAALSHGDIPGNEHDPMLDFDEWLENDMSGPADRPDATFVAIADGEVAGYAKLHLSSSRPTVATHDLTAVHPRWRRRGVARALKHAQIAWAAEAGYERLETANEVRNEPIRRLNEALGYRTIPGRELVRGPSARS